MNIESILKEQKVMAELQEKVTTSLVSSYGFLMEEAAEAVEKSVASSPDMWNENADPNELAKLLASGDDDD